MERGPGSSGWSRTRPRPPRSRKPRRGPAAASSIGRRRRHVTRCSWRRAWCSSKIFNWFSKRSHKATCFRRLQRSRRFKLRVSFFFSLIFLYSFVSPLLNASPKSSFLINCGKLQSPAGFSGSVSCRLTPKSVIRLYKGRSSKFKINCRLQRMLT